MFTVGAAYIFEMRFNSFNMERYRYENELSFLKQRIEELAEEMKITRNIHSDQHNIDTQKWKEEDKIYYETHSFLSVIERVKNQPYVTFVGGSGSGKSATAHHIALKLQKEGYEVVPVDEIREIKQYCDTMNPQVFVIDDVVGVFGLQKTKLDLLTDYEQKIVKPCMVKSRTLMTCREAVFNETLPYKPFLTNEETLIRLHSSDHALDDNDKKQILQKYGLNEDIMSPALLKLTSRIFPLLCKLFSKETKFKALGYRFFLNPVQCIIDELDNLQKHNKLNYATLVLCALNENSLSKTILKDRKNEHFMNMKIDTLENCELESQTDIFKFVKALSAMEGTYTNQSGAQYTFIHDSMFEICAYHYGQQFPDQMFLYMSSSYITNSVKPRTGEPGIAPKVKEKQSDYQSSNGDESSNDSNRKKESNDKSNESDDKSNEREESFDLCLRLREDQYPLLAERLYRDIQNMELYDVFRNPILKHPQVCQAFIGVLETKSYTELKSLFLSRHGKADKIVSKRKCVVKESGGMREWDNEWMRQEVLVDQRMKTDVLGNWNGELMYNVRVISWVLYYGHHQIIEYIIQQTAQHNQTSELLEITGNSSHQSKFEIFKKIKNTIFNRKQKKLEKYRLLVLGCYSGDVQTVRVLLPVCKEAVNGLGQISEDIDWRRDTPLTAACRGGHVDIVKELVKAGADVNLQNSRGDTLLITAVKQCSLSTVKCLVKHGANFVSQVVDFNVSVVYTALILNKPDMVKCFIQQQNKTIPGKFTGNVHLFNCLVKIRHAGVKTDSRDDVVVTDRSVWCMDREGDLWRAIGWRDCDVLRQLLCGGLDVNQSIQLYDGYTGKSDVRPLLYILIDESVKHRTEKVSILLRAGADVNVRMRYREYSSVFDRVWYELYKFVFNSRRYREYVLDREGVSVLERTRRRVCEYSESEYCKHIVPEYKKVMCEIKKHVRRHSV